MGAAPSANAQGGRAGTVTADDRATRKQGGAQDRTARSADGERSDARIRSGRTGGRHAQAAGKAGGPAPAPAPLPAPGERGPPAERPFAGNDAARFVDRAYERRHVDEKAEVVAPSDDALTPRSRHAKEAAVQVVRELAALFRGGETAVEHATDDAPDAPHVTVLADVQRRLAAVQEAAAQPSTSPADAERCQRTAALLAALLTRDAARAATLLRECKHPPRGAPATALPEETREMLAEVAWPAYHALVAELAAATTALDAVRVARERDDPVALRDALRRNALRQSHAAKLHGDATAAAWGGAEAALVLDQAHKACAVLEHEKRVLAAGTQLDALKLAVRDALASGLNPRNAQRRVWEATFNETFRRAIDRIDLPVVAACSSVAESEPDSGAGTAHGMAASGMLDASDLVAARVDGTFAHESFGGPLGGSDWLENPTYALSLVAGHPDAPCGPMQVTLTAIDRPCSGDDATYDGEVVETMGPFAIHVLANKLPSDVTASTDEEQPSRVRPGYLIVAGTEYADDAPRQTSVLLHPASAPVFVVVSRQAVAAPARFALVATLYRSDVPEETGGVRIRLEPVEPVFPKRTLAEVLAAHDKTKMPRNAWYRRVTDKLAHKLMAANVEGIENVSVLEARSWFEYQMVLQELILATTEEVDVGNVEAAVTRFCQFLGVPRALHPKVLLANPKCRAALEDDELRTPGGGQWSSVPRAHRPSGRQLMHAGILCMLFLQAKALAKRVADARSKIERAKGEGGSIAADVHALGAAVEELEDFVISAKHEAPMGVKLRGVPSDELAPLKDALLAAVDNLIDIGKDAAVMFCLSSVDSMLREGVAPTPKDRAEVEDAEIMSSRLDAISQSVDMDIRDPGPVLGTPYTRSDIKRWIDHVWSAVLVSMRDSTTPKKVRRGSKKATKTAIVDGALAHSTLFGADPGVFFLSNPQYILLAKSESPVSVTLVLGLSNIAFLGRCGVHVFETDAAATAPASLANARLVECADCSALPVALTVGIEPGKAYHVIPSVQALDACPEPLSFTMSATYIDDESNGTLEFAEVSDAYTLASANELMASRKDPNAIEFALMSLMGRLRCMPPRDLAANAWLQTQVMSLALRAFLTRQKLHLGFTLANREWRTYCRVVRDARSMLASMAKLVGAEQLKVVLKFADNLDFLEAIHAASNIGLGINMEYQSVDPSEAKAVLLSALHMHITTADLLDATYVKENRLPTHIEKRVTGAHFHFTLTGDALELMVEGTVDRPMYIVAYADDVKEPTLLSGVSFDVRLAMPSKRPSTGLDDSGSVVCASAANSAVRMLCDGFHETCDEDLIGSAMPIGAYAIAGVSFEGPAEGVPMLTVRTQDLCAGTMHVLVCTPPGVTKVTPVTMRKADLDVEAIVPNGGPPAFQRMPSALYLEAAPLFVVPAGPGSVTIRVSVDDPRARASVHVYKIAPGTAANVLPASATAIASSEEVGTAVLRNVRLNAAMNHVIVPWSATPGKATVRLETWTSHNNGVMVDVHRVR